MYLIKHILKTFLYFLEVYYDIKIIHSIENIKLTIKLITMKIKYIMIFAIIVSLFSCKAKQLPAEQKTQDKIVTVYKDSIREIIVNKKVIDTLYIEVPQAQTNDIKTDSVVNFEIKKILKNMRISKTSGDVKVGVDYNENKKLLTIAVNIPEVKNDTQKVNTNTNNTKKTTEIKYIEVERQLTKWQNITMFLGKFLIGFLLVIAGYKIFKLMNFKFFIK